MLTDYLKKRQQEVCFGNKKPEVEKKVYKIPIKAVKRIAEEKLYKKQLKEMLAENPNCEIRIPGVCMGKATGLHHLQKRSPKNYRKRENLVRACSECNLFIEENPTHELSKKFTISRFKNLETIKQ